MRKSGTPSAQAWMIKGACAREPIPRLRSSMEPFDLRLRARNELFKNSYPNVLWSITTPGPMVEERVTRFRY
jgi:hypothetical protein